MATETIAEKNARLARIRKNSNIFKGVFTTTSQAKKNKQLDDLQKTVNIAAASKNPKAGPKTKEETFSFRNQAAEANKKTTPKTSEVSKPKREKQSVASSITDAKIKKLDTSVKGENIKAKKERSLSESDKQKLAKLEKMQNRADKKQSRKDKSIERLAFRMGDKATFQDAAALKQKRSEARKQYLRNFASQLARGEQAAPRIAFGEGDGKPTTTSSLVGAQKEIDAKNEQASQDKKNIFNSVDTFKVPNASLGLTSIDMVGQNFGKDFMGQIEVPDSTPYDFMRKEYNKKRGY
jgi:hypothetical protein